MLCVNRTKLLKRSLAGLAIKLKKFILVIFVFFFRLLFVLEADGNLFVYEMAKMISDIAKDINLNSEVSICVIDTIDNVPLQGYTL